MHDLDIMVPQGKFTQAAGLLLQAGAMAI
jgi:hypothetical protein